MKPYLYLGIALLIVGLFSVSSILYYRLEASELQLSQAHESNDRLQKRVVSLVLREGKKEAAATAYMKVVEQLSNIAIGLQKTAAAYKARNTENEKCLDLTPPSDFVRLLDEDSVRGQGDLHSSERVPANPN